MRERIAAYLRREWKRFQRERDLATQRDFAKALGLHEATVSKILADTAPAGLDVMLALHDLFDVPAEYLFTRDPEAEYFEPVRTDGRARRQADRRRVASRIGVNDAPPRATSPSIAHPGRSEQPGAPPNLPRRSRRQVGKQT